MKTLIKKVQRSEDMFIQFSEEELKQFDLKEGDKFSCHLKDDGVMLEKFVPLDIDISEFSREALEMLIILSIEQDLSVNDVICNILQEQVDKACG